jgi:hypothetical protein
MRKILWNIYAWPISLLLIFVYSDLLRDFRFLPTLDMLASIPAVLALHFHIWDRKVGTAIFWKPYVFFFFAWELLFNLVLDPMTKGKGFDPRVLVIPVIFVPLYVGIVRYAYRKWTDKERHTIG